MAYLNWTTKQERDYRELPTICTLKFTATRTIHDTIDYNVTLPDAQFGSHGKLFSLTQNSFFIFIKWDSIIVNVLGKAGSDAVVFLKDKICYLLYCKIRKKNSWDLWGKGL